MARCSISRRSGLARVIRADKPCLVLIGCFGLTEREPSLPSHSLRRPHLFDRFLEPDVSTFSYAERLTVPVSDGSQID